MSDERVVKETLGVDQKRLEGDPSLYGGRMEKRAEFVQPAPSNEEVFPLDDAAIESLAEIDQQERQAASSFNGARQGILALFAKQHKLQGNWKLSDNKRELVKVTQQVA
jgi:hypothetical protein